MIIRSMSEEIRILYDENTKEILKCQMIYRNLQVLGKCDSCSQINLVEYRALVIKKFCFRIEHLDRDMNDRINY